MDLAAAGGADQADALARADVEAQVLEDRRAVGIGERHVLERHAGAVAHQGRRAGPVAQLVRNEQRRQRLGEARHVLRHVDQRDGQIARRVQHRQARACTPGSRRPSWRHCCCHSTIAHASRATVSATVTSACMMRSRSR